MVRITSLKVNIQYLKALLVFILITMGLTILSTRIQINSIVNQIDIDYFIDAMDYTLVIGSHNLTDKSKSINISNAFNGLCGFITGFDINKPETIISSQIFAIKQYQFLKDEITVSENSLAGLENVENSDIDKEQGNGNLSEKTEIQPAETVTSSKGITLLNETKYKIDFESVLSSPISIKKRKDGPLVLIYHTHACESYLSSDKYAYKPTDNDRTADINFNMVKVGEELAATLKNEYGIEVIHDTTLYDMNEYNSSYTKSALGVEQYLKKYPDISMIIDIHRDAANVNGQKMRVSTKIDGQSLARIMTVIGTDSRGVPHPYWRNNFKLGAVFADKMNKLYPGLSRGMNLKLGRFNQYLSQNSILIEVGANGNTLDEAVNSTKCIARVIADILK